MKVITRTFYKYTCILNEIKYEYFPTYKFAKHNSSSATKGDRLWMQVQDGFCTGNMYSEEYIFNMMRTADKAEWLSDKISHEFMPRLVDFESCEECGDSKIACNCNVELD